MRFVRRRDLPAERSRGQELSLWLRLCKSSRAAFTAAIATADDPPTVTITMVENAGVLGATKNTRGEPNQPSLVCGIPNQGAPGCSLPAGQAYCKRINFEGEQGQQALLIANADRGVAGGALEILQRTIDLLAGRPTKYPGCG